MDDCLLYQKLGVDLVNGQLPKIDCEQKESHSLDEFLTHYVKYDEENSKKASVSKSKVQGAQNSKNFKTATSLDRKENNNSNQTISNSNQFQHQIENEKQFQQQTNDKLKIVENVNFKNNYEPIVTTTAMTKTTTTNSNSNTNKSNIPRVFDTNLMVFFKKILLFFKI